jgi:hypothetical protein
MSQVETPLVRNLRAIASGEALAFDPVPVILEAAALLTEQREALGDAQLLGQEALRASRINGERAAKAMAQVAEQREALEQADKERGEWAARYHEADIERIGQREALEQRGQWIEELEAKQANIERWLERVRLKMLDTPTTEARESFKDGFHDGLVWVLQQWADARHLADQGGEER